MTILDQHPSALNSYLAALRDVVLQKNTRQFSDNLEQIGIIAGYELSKKLNYKVKDVTTPLGIANIATISDDIVIATVIRAGLPLQKGLASVFPYAELAFIGAGRKPENGREVEIDLSYVASPNLDGKTLIIADTMLATGHSLFDAYKAILKHGTPSKTYIVSVVAAQPGVEYIQKNMPEVEMFVATVDPELNEKFYIVPGLGDAGDLLYGEKE